MPAINRTPKIKKAVNKRIMFSFIFFAIGRQSLSAEKINRNQSVTMPLSFSFHVQNWIAETSVKETLASSSFTTFNAHVKYIITKKKLLSVKGTLPPLYVPCPLRGQSALDSFSSSACRSIELLKTFRSFEIID